MRHLLALLAACGGAATPKPTPAKTFTPTSFSVAVSGSGRPVIFIPGLACDGHVWDATVAHLGGKVQAHVLTLSGFGGRAPLDKPLLPVVRDEVVEYIRANHLEKPIVVGHSLGGFMTFWVAEAAPELIAGGVAVDGAPFMPALMDPSATAASAAPIAEKFRAQMGTTDEQFHAGERAFMASSMREPDKHADALAATLKSDRTATGDAMVFLFTTDLRGDLPKIKAPMLEIAADTHGQAPRAALEAVWSAQLATIPAHELVVIDHSKHFVMFDQPDAFYAALDGFLAKH